MYMSFGNEPYLVMDESFLHLLAVDKEIDGVKVDRFMEVMECLYDVDLSIDEKKNNISSDPDDTLMELLNTDRTVDKQKNANTKIMDPFLEQHSKQLPTKKDLQKMEVAMLSDPVFASLIATDLSIDGSKKNHASKSDNEMDAVMDLLAVDQQIDSSNKKRDSVHCALQDMLHIDSLVDSRSTKNHRYQKSNNEPFKKMEPYDCILSIDQEIDGQKKSKNQTDGAQALKDLLAVDREVDAARRELLKTREEIEQMQTDIQKAKFSQESNPAPKQESSGRRSIFTKKEKYMANYSAAKYTFESDMDVVKPLLAIDRMIDKADGKKSEEYLKKLWMELLEIDILVDKLKGKDLPHMSVFKTFLKSEENKKLSSTEGQQVSTPIEKSSTDAVTDSSTVQTTFSNSSDVVSKKKGRKLGKKTCVIM